jgi:hypothetical protein
MRKTVIGQAPRFCATFGHLRHMAVWQVLAGRFTKTYQHIFGCLNIGTV